MKHAKVTRARAWRAAETGRRRGARLGVLSAFGFNLCLLALALASAAVVAITKRDNLYAYEYSDAGARAIDARIERLNGRLIQLDFDRLRQWDDLVAMELMARDVDAARGFLLSARGMLPSRTVNQINRRMRGKDDAALELAALELLTPGTRARYEATVPLLSRRAASGAAQARILAAPPPADPENFELMARALIEDPTTSASPFVLAGLNLGLGGEFTPRMARGASVLAAAARREDYPASFHAQADALIAAALPMESFRQAALASAPSRAQAGAFNNAAAAFRAAINPTRAEAAKAALDEIGAMAEAISPAAAAALISHAATLRDLPRLRLIAQAAGPRAAAAAKRLARDGALTAAARGELTITRDLAAAIAAALTALLGLIAILALRVFQSGRSIWLNLSQRDDHDGQLVDLSRGEISRNWRPL